MKHTTPKTENFTIIANTCLRDKTLSLKAKGLHTFIMTLPDDWQFSLRRENERLLWERWQELSAAIA